MPFSADHDARIVNDCDNAVHDTAKTGGVTLLEMLLATVTMMLMLTLLQV